MSSHNQLNRLTYILYGYLSAQQNAFVRHILRCLLKRKPTRRRRRNVNVSQACSLLPTGRSVFLPNRPRPAATLRTQARWPRSATCQAPLGDSPIASVAAFSVTFGHRHSFPSHFFDLLQLFPDTTVLRFSRRTTSVMDNHV